MKYQTYFLVKNNLVCLSCATNKNAHWKKKALMVYVDTDEGPRGGLVWRRCRVPGRPTDIGLKLSKACYSL